MKIVMLLPFILLVNLACDTKELPKPSDELNLQDAVQEVTKVNFATGDFIRGAKIDNPYFSINSGKKIVYEGEFEGLPVKVEYIFTDKHKEILGVLTQGVWRRQWHDGLLVSDIKQWYAQDKQSKVWLFAEEKQHLSHGKLWSTFGSWQADDEYFKPALVMMRKPKIGEEFHSGYFNDTEVFSKVIEIEKITKEHKICLMLKEYNPSFDLERGFKNYCSDSSFLSLVYDEKGRESLKLLNISIDASFEGFDKEYSPLGVKYDEEDAMKKAVNAIEGEVMDISMSHDGNKYLVFIKALNEKNFKVVVNANSADVLEKIEY